MPKPPHDNPDRSNSAPPSNPDEKPRLDPLDPLDLKKVAGGRSVFTVSNPGRDEKSASNDRSSGD